MALTSSLHRSGPHLSAVGHHATVLCIVTDAESPSDVALHLRREGLAVLRALSPEQGYWLALDNVPDAIVLVGSSTDPSVRMVLRRFASHTLTQDTPIVLLEERGASNDNAALAELGVVARLRQTVAAGQLVAVVRKHLRPVGRRGVMFAAG